MQVKRASFHVILVLLLWSGSIFFLFAKTYWKPLYHDISFVWNEQNLTFVG